MKLLILFEGEHKGHQLTLLVFAMKTIVTCSIHKIMILKYNNTLYLIVLDLIQYMLFLAAEC